MAGFSRGLSSAFQSLRSRVDGFLRVSQEARARAAANSLEQNKAKVTTTAAEFVAVTTTYLPQVIVEKRDCHPKSRIRYRIDKISG